MEIIENYFPGLSAEQKDQFAKLQDIYEDWNSKINVISRKDMDQFYIHHVLHSLAIAKLDFLKPKQMVLDVGTGGGFPGIPLAIFYPDTQFTLIDSIAKKIKVVNAAKDALGLHNVVAYQERMENLRLKADVIVSRAVAPALKLIELTKNQLKETGTHLFLKGGDLSAEIAEVEAQYLNAYWNEHQLKNWFKEDFFETKKLIVFNT